MFFKYLERVTNRFERPTNLQSTNTFKRPTDSLFVRMAPTKKLTIEEAREWVENALRNFDRSDFTKLDDALNGEAIAVAEYIDTFRPVKSKTPKQKKTPSPKKEVTPDAPFDPSCCHARANKKDVNGFRVNCQCSNKRPENGDLCPTHTKTKNSKKGLELGLYNDERPTAWADGSIIIWNDSSEEIKDAGKKKEKRKVTCAICGVVGHTKTKCPQKSEGSDEMKTEKKVEKKVEKKAEQNDGVGNEVFIGNEVVITKGVKSNGDEYEVEIHTCLPTSHQPDDVMMPENFEPEPELSDDDGPTYSPGSPKPLDDSQKTEPLSDVGELEYDCASDNEEDESKPLTYEGVQYELDGDGVAVYDDDGDHVGNWDGEKIDFLNGGWRKSHEEKKNEVPEEPSLESLSWKQLKDKAKELGVSSDEIEEASDLEGKERVEKIISFIQQKM
jgi:hypothetical protein